MSKHVVATVAEIPLSEIKRVSRESALKFRC